MIHRHKIKMKKPVISIDPAWAEKPNPYTQLFARCLDREGIEVHDFTWHDLRRQRCDAVIFHWPNTFFRHGSVKHFLKSRLRLTLMKKQQAAFGTKFIWVAHNVLPHDINMPNYRLANLFFRRLDSIIFLSKCSRTIITDIYPILRGKKYLVIKHGHYRDILKQPSFPPMQAEKTTELLFFGQLRSYKGIIELVEAVTKASQPDIRLTIIGQSKSGGLQNKLMAIAAAKPNISINIKMEQISQLDIETAIDHCHGVVLPYRDILNSGSALFALSRNRPILAPRIGSLPELQQDLGKNWVHLYDGNLTAEILGNFARQLTYQPMSDGPDLSLYEWPLIGRQIASFITAGEIARCS